MGALISGAVPGLRCPEEANLRAPESVVAVHAGYIAAGAELIETNTFGANRRKLGRALLEDAFEEINSAGVRLAREAREVAGRDVFIAGSIGPLGELEVFDLSEHGPLYAAQASVLEGRGVDLFMVETFFDLDELVVAVEAVRSVSSLPIVALLTFDDEAEVTGGVDAAAAARRLVSLGVAAIGTNHGAGPTVALRALRGMRDAGLPLAALPNIGLASLAGGRVVYPHSTPDYFAEFAVQAVALGARIVGGCCGTTPAQIEAIHDAFEGGRVPAAMLEVDEPSIPLAPPPKAGETRLARALPRAGVGRQRRARPAEGRLARRSRRGHARASPRSRQVGFVDINDNPMARARMNALMTASTLQREVGIETIPHVTPRDTSVMGLEGVLLGAHADGVRNVLAVTGDPPHVGDYPGSRGVYEVDSIGLVQLLAGLNRGEDYVGKGLDAPDRVLHRRRRQPVGRRPRARARPVPAQGRGGSAFRDDAGDLRSRAARPVRRAARRRAGRSRCCSASGRSGAHAMALRLHNEVPGISVPGPVLDALQGRRPRRPGAWASSSRARSSTSRAARVAGIYVIPPFKQPLGALDLLA